MYKNDFFLFQYEEYLKTLKFEKVPDSVYYMKQTISNACGTVAMIHSVANTMEQVNLDNGHLKDFLESTREKSPEERATELEGNAKICEVHDNIAREGQTAAPSLEDNVDYHFIAFVEKDGILWDLDGRKTAPVNCGSSSKETFLQVCYCFEPVMARHGTALRCALQSRAAS